MSKFQQRHYEAIAECVQRADRFCETDNQRRGVERLRNEMIMMFASDNAMFNRARFERACVPGANVKNRVN